MLSLRESAVRILEIKCTGVNAKDWAQTGAPIIPKTVLMPTVRRKVLFPDMLDPVINMTCPRSPMEKSLLTRWSTGSKGCAQALPESWNAPEVSTSGKAHSGWAKRKPDRLANASISAIPSNQDRMVCLFLSFHSSSLKIQNRSQKKTRLRMT